MRDFSLKITSNPLNAEIIDLSSGDTINLGPFNIVDIRVERRPMEKQIPQLVTVTLRVRGADWGDYHIHADENIHSVAYIDGDALRVEAFDLQGADLEQYVRMDEVRITNINTYDTRHTLIDGRGVMYLELPLYPKELIEVPENDTSK